MKIGRLLGIGVVAGALWLPQVMYAQQQATTNYQSIVIETFDDSAESRWIVTGSKFATEGLPQASWVRTWPDALYRREPEGRNLHSLGIRAAFDRQGYNYLEITPVDEDDEPRGIPIPGRVRHLDMWVWGSNFDYYMDIHLRDYRGVVHVLKLGDINYRGWRNLRIMIPSYIPQDTRYTAEFNPVTSQFDAAERELELVKIVMWTRPSERVSGFFLYLDEIKVETDLFRQPFDGELLADPAVVNELWSGQ